MILKKDIKTSVYEVIADYKVKIENAPFIAILKFAEENGGVIYQSLVHEELLAPLSEKACGNLLERLTSMGYFQKEQSDDFRHLPQYEDEFQQKIFNYKLTELGYESAQKEEFYDQRHGLLKLHVAEENEFIEQRVVKVEESNRDIDRETEVQKLNSELKELTKSTVIIKLKKDSFILDKFEEKCKVLKTETHNLTFAPNNQNSIVNILDFENDENYTESDLKNLFLTSEFGKHFIKDRGIVGVRFSSENIVLNRTFNISTPQINQTKFNSIEIPNIKVSPITFEDAKKWHSTLLKVQIKDYFLSDKEFTEFANREARKFELYSDSLTNSISRKEFAEQLNTENDFYAKAKLGTIDFLNY